MNIGFDAKRFFNNFTGLGNYSRFIVDALVRVDSNDEFYLFSTRARKHPETQKIIENANVHTVVPGTAYRTLHLNSLWRTWTMSYHPIIKELDVFHGLSQELPYQLPAHIKKVVTVHDLIFLRYPEFYNPIDVKIYKWKVKSACERADKIIAISRQTADDLITFLQVDSNKIEVVYQGCHPIFKCTASLEEKLTVKQKYNLPDQFILNVGTIERRKNVILLVKALSDVPGNLRLPIVIIGRQTDYKNEIIACAKELNVLNEIIFLHNASFADFPAIYQQAKVFVYPSLFEGFGIPLVEAIESGIPVITSTGSCFKEAAGPAAVYVDPTDARMLATQLINILGDDMLRQEMIKESSEYIKKFEPVEIGKALYAIYNSH